MYLSHYKLDEKPFQINVDSRFLWSGEKHKEAFAILKFGVLDNKGFILLTGDVGTGKTTLINALVKSLSKDDLWATINDPGLDVPDFYKYIAHRFNLEANPDSKAEFLIRFEEFLNHAFEQGKRVLLIIDEAQRLSQELLEEIRLLSNIERENVKLLNIFFVGQTEFNRILLDDRNRAIRQRITVSYRIEPLSEKETAEYIHYRLGVAGCTKRIFTPAAIHNIFLSTGGYPRLINVICDIALMTGYAKGVTHIGEHIIRESFANFEMTHHQDNGMGKPPVDEGIMTDSELEKKKRAAAGGGGFSGEIKNRIKGVAWLIVFVVLVFWGGYYLSNFFHTISPAHLSAGIVKQGEGVKPFKENDKTGSPKGEGGKKGSGEGGIGRDPASLFKEGKLVIDFAYNSTEFSEQAYNLLGSVAEVMKQNPDLKIVVKGYTDSLGTKSYNGSLSLFRANMVTGFLAGKGVALSRMHAFGLGAQNPRQSNETLQGRMANRRVEIEIYQGMARREGARQ